MAGNPKLKLLSKKFRGKAFELVEERYTLGRTEETDICIPDPSISTHHALLVYGEDDDYVIQDLGSTNGTRVNGVSSGQDPVPLSHGDILQIGGIEIFYD